MKDSILRELDYYTLLALRKILLAQYRNCGCTACKILADVEENEINKMKENKEFCVNIISK